MLSSDHSPSEPALKLFEEGNFLKAWGGISSLQVDIKLPSVNYGNLKEYLIFRISMAI